MTVAWPTVTWNFAPVLQAVLKKRMCRTCKAHTGDGAVGEERGAGGEAGGGGRRRGGSGGSGQGGGGQRRAEAGGVRAATSAHETVEM